jgi:hypothetical protein
MGSRDTRHTQQDLRTRHPGEGEGEGEGEISAPPPLWRLQPSRSAL